MAGSNDKIKLDEIKMFWRKSFFFLGNKRLQINIVYADEVKLNLTGSLGMSSNFLFK